MRFLLLTIFFCCLGIFSLKSQSISDVSKNIKYKDFSRGEKLIYLAHYGFIDAGEAVVTLSKKLKKINGKPTYDVTVKGRTIGVFGWTTKVRDTWKSNIDTATMQPLKFERNIKENSYELKETSLFNHKEGTVAVEKNKKGTKSDSTFNIPEFTQDIISGYYCLRTLDFSNLHKGDTVRMNAFMEDEHYNFKIIFLGNERIATQFGKINTFVMSPIMPKNDLFDGENSIKFWVSNDSNRVPIKIKAEMFVGAVEIDLVRHSGLKSKFNKSKK